MKRSEEELEHLFDRMEVMLDDYESGKDAESRQHWKDSYSDKLGEYEDVMKRMNGDDFDLYSQSYDEYHRDFSDMDEGTYIDRLVIVLQEHIDKLKDALHTDELTIESTDDGTTIQTDTEDESDGLGVEDDINAQVDGAGEDGSSMSPEELAELEEVSKSTPRHY